MKSIALASKRRGITWPNMGIYFHLKKTRDKAQSFSITQTQQRQKCIEVFFISSHHNQGKLGIYILQILSFLAAHSLSCRHFHLVRSLRSSTASESATDPSIASKLLWATRVTCCFVTWILSLYSKIEFQKTRLRLNNTITKRSKARSSICILL